MTLIAASRGNRSKVASSGDFAASTAIPRACCGVMPPLVAVWKACCGVICLARICAIKSFRLGASSGGASKSYLADPSAVWFWHSAPTRLDRLQEDVEGYDLGVWGYWAGVISDLTGLKKITYDPTA